MKKCYIVEESVTVTYFHKVYAEDEKQAEEKFYDGDAEYNFRDEEHSDDATLWIYEDEDGEVKDYDEE